MNKTGQGVHRLNEVKISLIQIILLVATCLASTVSAVDLSAGTGPATHDTEKQRIFILSSVEGRLHSDIIRSLSDNLRRNLPDAAIIRATPGEQKLSLNNRTDIIIGIGSAGMKSANTLYPNTRKLFISTDPNKYQLDKSKNKNDAILYMSQPYCRQMKFIKLVNENWKVIGLLSSQKKPVDTHVIKKCAKKHGLELYAVENSNDKKISTDIKQVLDRSDALLALPDKNIYNSKTVKNILLTSYRYRKPVFAFSKNFVNAGALASIHSSTRQIGETASELIEYYFTHKLRFKNSINYPRNFDLDINRQVFKALALPVPDTYKLKQKLINNNTESPGDIK